MDLLKEVDSIRLEDGEIAILCRRKEQVAYQDGYVTRRMFRNDLVRLLVRASGYDTERGHEASLRHVDRRIELRSRFLDTEIFKYCFYP